MDGDALSLSLSVHGRQQQQQQQARDDNQLGIEKEIAASKWGERTAAEFS